MLVLYMMVIALIVLPWAYRFEKQLRQRRRERQRRFYQAMFDDDDDDG